MEQEGGHEVGEPQGYEAGEQSEDDVVSGVLLHALDVHLQSGEEHDVIESYASEELEGAVALQNVQAELPDEHTCQYHANDMRNPEFTHDDRGKQDDEQHHEEDERGVGDGEICGQS